MASLRKQTSKTGKISYLVDFCHQGKRIKKSFPNKRDAKAFLFKVLEIKAGIRPWA